MTQKQIEEFTHFTEFWDRMIAKLKSEIAADQKGLANDWKDGYITAMTHAKSNVTTAIFCARFQHAAGLETA